MQQLLIYFFIALGLSMDAFSLALAYGTNRLTKKNIILLSLFVGTFHFFMPLLGSVIGINLLEHFVTKSNIIVALIFLVLAIEMYLSRNEEKKGSIDNLLSILIFSFTVSIDSFSVGIGLGLTNQHIFNAALIFSIVSGIITYLGLILGEKLYNKYEKKATYVGIVILILIAISYLI